jgi:hypothetical protein
VFWLRHVAQIISTIGSLDQTIHRALLYSCLHAHPAAQARAPEATTKKPNRSSSTSPSLSGDSPVASPALPSAASMTETASRPPSKDPPPPNDRFPSPTPHLPASPAICLLECSVSPQVSELEGHEGDVTAVVVVALPAATTAKLVSNCWTAGLDGVLIYWDFMVAEALRKVHIGLPVHSMVSSSCLFFSISLFDGMC